jgi:hypothetical protein
MLVVTAELQGARVASIAKTKLQVNRTAGPIVRSAVGASRAAGVHALADEATVSHSR